MKPKETSEHYILSSSPHAHSKTSVHSIMRDVIIALMPASACAVWFFGIMAVWLMATDYVMSPITANGKIAFGIGCGLLTMCIRSGGGYLEGVSFAILIMNAITPLINRFTQPKPFGGRENRRNGVCAFV